MPRVIIVKKNNKPYFVGLESDLKQEEYFNLVKECEERALQEEQEKNDLLKKIRNLEQQIHELKGHVLFDEGKISEEEYNDGRY